MSDFDGWGLNLFACKKIRCILIESLKFRNNSRITVTSPSRNLLWKMWIWVFWKLCFVIIFLQKRPCKAWLKITLPMNKLMQKVRRNWSMRQRGVSLLLQFAKITCIRMSEAVTRRCSMKKVFLKMSQNLQKSTCLRVSFLIKTSGNFIKIEASPAFSYEFCEIFKNTFFMEHHRWLRLEYVFIWIIFCYF